MAIKPRRRIPSVKRVQTNTLNRSARRKYIKQRVLRSQQQRRRSWWLDNNDVGD